MWEPDIISFFLEDTCFSREIGCAGVGYGAIEQVGQNIGSDSFYATRNQGKQLSCCASYVPHQRKNLGTLRYINTVYWGFFETRWHYSSPCWTDRDAGSCGHSSTSLLAIFYQCNLPPEASTPSRVSALWLGGPRLPAEVHEGRTMCVGSLGGYHSSQPRKLLGISIPWAPGRNLKTLRFNRSLLFCSGF